MKIILTTELRRHLRANISRYSTHNKQSSLRDVPRCCPSVTFQSTVHLYTKKNPIIWGNLETNSYTTPHLSLNLRKCPTHFSTPADAIPIIQHLQISNPHLNICRCPTHNSTFADILPISQYLQISYTSNMKWAVWSLNSICLTCSSKLCEWTESWRLKTRPTHTLLMSNEVHQTVKHIEFKDQTDSPEDKGSVFWSELVLLSQILTRLLNAWGVLEK